MAPWNMDCRIFSDFVFLPEGDVDAEAEVGPGVVDGNKLLGILRGKVVGPEEHVEAGAAEVENGAYRAAHVGYRPVDGEVQHREGAEVDGRHALGVGAVTAEAGGGEQTERDGVVEYGILGTHAQSGAQRVGHRPGVRLVEFG